ncbi:MAG TPA: hypothetical protein VHP12_00830 [Chitinophagaceae bacterium]|nr:hypothetical protein [Chitinophagaceae bacterium]
MSNNFNPTEEGNFIPLKLKADSLVIIATAWKSSLIPDNYKPTETKETLEQLIIKCTAVPKAAKQNADANDFKKPITAAYNTFHKIATVYKTKD